MIPQAHYYVHADHTDSHDSRYEEIGLIPLERIRGRALPLPDIPWLGLEGAARKARGGAAMTRRPPLSRFLSVAIACVTHLRGGLRDREGSGRRAARYGPWRNPTSSRKLRINSKQ